MPCLFKVCPAHTTTATVATTTGFDNAWVDSFKVFHERTNLISQIFEEKF